MIAILGAALAVLPIQAGQGQGDLVFRHDVSPKYNRTDYESACGPAIFRVRFRNGPGAHGQVDWVSIDGRPVAGAARQLQVRAARRVISRIEIMNCGPDPRNTVFRGMLDLSPIESHGLGMRPSLYFRLSRQGRGPWRLTVD